MPREKMWLVSPHSQPSRMRPNFQSWTCCCGMMWRRGFWPWLFSCHRVTSTCVFPRFVVFDSLWIWDVFICFVLVENCKTYLYKMFKDMSFPLSFPTGANSLWSRWKISHVCMLPPNVAVRRWWSRRERCRKCDTTRVGWCACSKGDWCRWSSWSWGLGKVWCLRVYVWMSAWKCG